MQRIVMKTCEMLQIGLMLRISTKYLDFYFTDSNKYALYIIIKLEEIIMNRKRYLEERKDNFDDLALFC